MRNTVIAVAIGLSVLTGCSSPSPSGQDSSRSQPTSAPSTSAPAVASVPKPDTGQEKALLAALAAIDPALDHERSISRARDTCQTILAGEDAAKVVSMTQQRFDGTASVSAADAKKIVKLIKDSDWCR